MRIVLGTIVGFYIFVSFVVEAPTERAVVATANLPETHAGRCAQDFFKTFNSGSLDELRAFETAHRAKSALQQRSIEDRLKQFQGMKSQWGRLEVRQIVASEERGIKILVHAELPDEHFEFRFVFEEPAPYGLLRIEIEGPIAVEIGAKALTPLTPELRSSSLESIAASIESHYVFPEVGSKMAALLREKSASKAYDAVSNPHDLAQRVTDDLRAVCQDKHLTVRAGGLPDFHGGGPMRRKGTPDDARRENYGFREVELLPGNIGYIRFDEFNPSEEAKQVAAAAMAFVAGCDTLIFDLRNNGGGSPEMIRFLSSYLFDKPTHLNSFFDRSNNKTEEFWTLESVPGKRFRQELPVFVLISSHTFSGAEEFAYNLRNLERATLVGTTTGGGAHPVKTVVVNEQFSMMVPFARAVNPITKTNWEGVGVKPHVEVETGDALDKAKALAAAEIQKRRRGETKP